MIHLDIETQYSYHELVAAVIEAGIVPQRAYMFLASLGIKGELCRFWDKKLMKYGKPVKVAVNDAGGVIMSPKAVFVNVDLEALLLKEVAPYTDK